MIDGMIIWVNETKTDSQDIRISAFWNISLDVTVSVVVIKQGWANFGFVWTSWLSFLLFRKPDGTSLIVFELLDLFIHT